MRGQWKIVISKSRSSFRNGRVAEAHHCVELCSRWARHGAAADSQGAETDAVIYAGSPKLDNRRLEKGCLVGSVSMSAVTFRRMGSGFGVTAWKHQSILFSISSSGWWCVCVFLWHTWGLLQTAECRLAQFVLNRFHIRDHYFPVLKWPALGHGISLQ